MDMLKELKDDKSLNKLDSANKQSESITQSRKEYFGAWLLLRRSRETIRPNIKIRQEVVSMCVVSIDVPEEILLDLHEDKNDFAEYMKKMLALDLYKNKRVSLGYCSSVAGMTKEEFVQYLSMNDVSIFSFASEDEFLEELQNA